MVRKILILILLLLLQLNKCQLIINTEGRPVNRSLYHNVIFDFDKIKKTYKSQKIEFGKFFSRIKNKLDFKCIIEKIFFETYYLPKYREDGFPPPSVFLRNINQIKPSNSKVVYHGDRKQKLIALTFDACSTLVPSRFDEAVYSILVDFHVPSTIFLGGKWVLDRPEDAKKIASIPFFEIGNHGYLHGNLTKVSKKRAYYELKWTQEIIYTYLDVIPKVFRPPYGVINKSGTDIAATLGLQTIQFDLASGDPSPTMTKKKLVDRVVNFSKGGSIVVLHINKGGKHTAEALPVIIMKLREKGYRFVTVSKLISMSKSSIYTEIPEDRKKQRKDKFNLKFDSYLDHLITNKEYLEE